LRIPLPPFKLQKEFSEIMNKTESVVAEQRQSAQEMDNQFNALIQKYFDGE